MYVKGIHKTSSKSTICDFVKYNYFLTEFFFVSVEWMYLN